MSHRGTLRYLFCAATWSFNTAKTSFNLGGDFRSPSLHGLADVRLQPRPLTETSVVGRSHGVTDMNGMFDSASSFNQDLGGWAVHSVTEMDRHATTKPRPSTRTSAGAWTTALTPTGGTALPSKTRLRRHPVRVDVVRRRAEWSQLSVSSSFPSPGRQHGRATTVAAWDLDAATAEATCSHISTWETSGVTDMSHLFCVRQDWMEANRGMTITSYRRRPSARTSVAWDISVTRMYGIFWYASSFNQVLAAGRR